AGTEEEQAKNFQWGLHRSTINHLMCMSYTDVAQVANAAHNYEILHERDDDDTERPDKRQKSGDRHQPTSQQSSHRSHGHNNDHRGSDRRGGSDNHCSSNNNYSGILVMDGTRETGVISPTDLPILVLSSPRVPLRATLTQYALLVDVDTKESVVELQVLVSSVVKLAIYRRIARRTPLQAHLDAWNSGYGRDQRNRGQQSNRSANSGSQQSRGPSEGYSYLVCTTCRRRHPGECRRAAAPLLHLITLPCDLLNFLS
nr:hypothetical protein [Tanacetum cinerariifolium]